MNEIALSSDLQTIELEINHHKNIAGQSIWEIGRRLNHVKENDLAHGEFIDWVESIGINHPEANRMMRVAKELPNSSTLTNLGSTALYLIASLPEEERTKKHATEKGESKTPDEMTVRELQQLNKRVKLKLEIIDQKNETINRQAEEVKQLKNQKPEVIGETIEKEVTAVDYEKIKQANSDYMQEINLLRDQYRELVSQRSEEESKTKRYDELTEAINDMEGRMDRNQKRIQSQKQVYELVDKSKDLLQAITPIPYLLDAEFVRENPVAKRELESISLQTQKFLGYLNGILKETSIIEGEIIND